MRLAGWLNWAWQRKCRREADAFEAARQNVADAQREQLARIVTANRATAYGQRFGFGSIHSVSDFQTRVPLNQYEDLLPWIDRCAQGESCVLTEEPIRLFEPTGGSTGGAKLIPYTAGLQRDFQRGVATWIADLFARRPSAARGRAYWSISPALAGPRRTAGGTPIGFDDDAAYLGGFEQWALRHLLVAPSQLARCQNLDAFRYATLFYLLAADDLSLVSVWHPSFLTRLVESIDIWAERICHDLRRGTLSTPDNNPRQTNWPVRASPARAERILVVLRSNSVTADRLRQLWSELALISCWTDAKAALPARELNQLFPEVELQGKGLLATEAFVTLPLVDLPAPALAVRSHFFEFLAGENADPASASPQCHLAHQLDTGGHYRVVVTTSGGLYRYQLHDEVQVVGHWGDCPLLKFMGKADQTSDLVGEKLSEAHVQAAVDAALATQRLRPRFALLAPCLGDRPRYQLFLQVQIDAPPQVIAALATDLEQGLRRNPHYEYAVGLRQLAPLEVVLLPPELPAAAIYEEQCLAGRQRLGNIKPAVLSRLTDWHKRFLPLELESPAHAAADRQT